jgi:large subunit ribosomal protein L4e
MVKVFSLNGTQGKEIALPKVFSVIVRNDLIKRAFLAERSNSRQAYGTNFLAGLRTSAHYHGVKDTRGSMKNREIARMPRSHNSSPQQEWRARRVPQSVGGRRTHPPKAYKIWDQKINRKEAKLAMSCAIAASAVLENVKNRGHIFDGELPIVFENDIQKISKTKELKTILKSVNLDKDLARGEKKKVRAGRGKMRGRKYKRKKSVLFIVDGKQEMVKSVSNLQGCEICDVNTMKISLLAPGAVAGRLIVWSEGAINKLGEIYG